MTNIVDDSVDRAFPEMMEKLLLQMGGGMEEALHPTIRRVLEQLREQRRVTSSGADGQNIASAVNSDSQNQPRVTLLGQRRVAPPALKPRAEREKHWSLRPLVEMSQACWDTLRHAFGITVTVKRCHPPCEAAVPVPYPVRCWEELWRSGAGPPAAVADALRGILRQRFFLPTPVQMQVLPAATQYSSVAASLSTWNILAVAETGSGKSLCYILSAITWR